MIREAPSASVEGGTVTGSRRLKGAAYSSLRTGSQNIDRLARSQGTTTTTATGERRRSGGLHGESKAEGIRDELCTGKGRDVSLWGMREIAAASIEAMNCDGAATLATL